MEYAINNKLDWREDQSNQSDYYQRNLIRNQVVPLLKELNPALENTTLNTAEIIRSAEQQYKQSLNRLRERLFIHDQQHTRISKAGIRQMKPALLSDLLGSYGFSLDQCRSVLQQALDHTGKIFSSHSHTLNIDREEIIISPISQQENELEIYPELPGIIRVNGDKWCLKDYPAGSYRIDPAKDIGAFDLDKLEFPLMLRHWQPGDQFIPLGMKYKKKLSDFFN